MEFMEEATKLAEKYGEPAFYRKTKENDVLIALNEGFWATFATTKMNVCYVLDENAFFLYNRETGIWEEISDNKLSERIAALIIERKQEFAEKLSSYFLRGTLGRLKGMVEQKTFFTRSENYFIHCKNGILIYENGKWLLKPFDASYHSRNQNSIQYDPKAHCDNFLNNLLRTAMTEDDIKILQLYVGQCLLGNNLSQTFLLLLGTPGGGKSTLVNVIEMLIGRWNCTELRTEHLNGRFEIGRARGKTLLTAKDVPSNFLQLAGAKKLKAITGDDTMTLEQKCKNTVSEITGCLNVIIVSNARLQLHFDGDEEAWRRRLLLISYERPATTEKIVNFDKKLIQEEGSGILNWALEGAANLLAHGEKIYRSEEQKRKAEALLLSSDPIGYFVKNHIAPSPEHKLPVSRAILEFRQFCKDVGWSIPSERKIQLQIKETMFALHGIEQSKNIDWEGHAVRGYCGCRICTKAHS